MDLAPHRCDHTKYFAAAPQISLKHASKPFFFSDEAHHTVHGIWLRNHLLVRYHYLLQGSEASNMMYPLHTNFQCTSTFCWTPGLVVLLILANTAVAAETVTAGTL